MGEVHQLLHKLNVNLPKQKVRQMFQVRPYIYECIQQPTRSSIGFGNHVLCNSMLDCMQEADTDENQGSLGFEEFCSFYKMISTRRDLYLIMISYSNQKEVMDLHDLARFLENEQKVQENVKLFIILAGEKEIC